MKILLITPQYPPEVNAPASRTYDHCKWWAKNCKADITVICPAPNFPQGKVYDGYVNRFYSNEKIDGINVIRVWSWIVPNEGSFLKRTCSFLSFALMATIVGALQKRPDVIVATSPQFFTTFSGFFLSHLKSCPWIFEVRDMWPEGIIFLRKNSLVYKTLEKIEMFFYHSCEKIITVTHSFKKDILLRCPKIKPEKITVITNGSNTKIFRPQLKNEDLLRPYGLEGKFIVGYAGTHGISHGLDFILRTLKRVEKEIPCAHFLFIGTGSEKSLMLNIAETLNLRNVSFLDPVSKSILPEMISLFDIGLVPLKKKRAFLRVIPSKIFELCTMEKPILLGVSGEARDIVLTNKAGRCFDPENENSFIEQLNLLYSERNKFKELYLRGLKKISNEFDRAYLAEKMYKEVLAKIVG